MRQDLLQNIAAVYGLGLDEPSASIEPGYIRLTPLIPEVGHQAGLQVRRFVPSAIAVSEQWLQDELGLDHGTARYAVLDDDGMAPRLVQHVIVIVDISGRTLRSGVHLVQLAGELVARRLANMPGDEYALTADSDPNWRFVGSADKMPVLHPIVWGAAKL